MLLLGREDFGALAYVGEYVPGLLVAVVGSRLEHGEVDLATDCAALVRVFLSLLCAFLPDMDVLAMVGHLALELAQPADDDVAVETVVQFLGHHALAEAGLDVAKREVVEILVVKNQLGGERNLCVAHVAPDVEESVQFVEQYAYCHHRVVATYATVYLRQHRNIRRSLVSQFLRDGFFYISLWRFL